MNRFDNKVVVITGAAGWYWRSNHAPHYLRGRQSSHRRLFWKKSRTACRRTHSCRSRRTPRLFLRYRTSKLQRVDCFSMNEYGRIDVLINNVGGTWPQTWPEYWKAGYQLFRWGFPLESLLYDVSVPTGHSHYDNQRRWKHCQRSFDKRTDRRCPTARYTEPVKRGLCNLTKYIATQREEKYPLQCRSSGTGSYPRRLKQSERRCP